MRFQAHCSNLYLDEHPSHLPKAAETLLCAGEQPLHSISLVKLVKQSIWTPLESRLKTPASTWALLLKKGKMQIREQHYHMQMNSFTPPGTQTQRKWKASIPAAEWQITSQLWTFFKVARKGLMQMKLENFLAIHLVSPGRDEGILH